MFHIDPSWMLFAARRPATVRTHRKTGQPIIIKALGSSYLENVPRSYEVINSQISAGMQS
jgi:hypothetical protein